MLLHPGYRILAAALLLVAFCAASSNSSDETNAALWDMVPACARKCTENFIQTEYTSAECSEKSNIKCLCRSKTPSNLTIGEAALTCVYALCSEKIKKTTDVYHICDSVPGALTETHATLTATTFAPASSTTTSSTAETTTSSTRTTHAADTTSLETSKSTTSTLTTSETAAEITSYHPSTSASDILPYTSSDTSTATPTNSSTTVAGKSGSNGTSPGTVIGVSVVSGVAGCFIIGVAVFFCTKRWRKKNQRDFEIGGDMSEPSNFSEPSHSRGPSPNLNPGPSELNAMRSPLEMSQVSLPPRSLQSTPYPQNSTAPGIRLVETPRDEHNQRIGCAVTSESDWEGSPRTVDSQHTMAELLPSPSVGLVPKPLKLWHRPASGGTVFEEDENHFMAEKSLPPLPSTRRYQNLRQSPVILGLPSNPRAPKEGFPASKFRRVQNQHPSPIQTKSPRERPAGPRALGPPFSAQNRRSIISNSSSGQNDSSGLSDYTSNTYLTTPPFSTAQGRILSGTPQRKLPTQVSPPSTLAPAPDIVSIPRIVRGEDIKRIPPGERPPSEVVVPYCPEDFWLERGRGNTPSRTVSTELPYPSEMFPGVVLYPDSPKKRPEDAPRRISPTSRNLTPSKRGDDLILRVD
ncbi:hypothetical protein N7507_010843 [Penicillium longicatenatum]|nr:hypothetical protein N7507_010843 [Penicillium longicatenatum]